MSVTVYFPLFLLIVMVAVSREPIQGPALLIGAMTILTIVNCTAEILRAIRETKKDGSPGATNQS